MRARISAFLEFYTILALFYLALTDHGDNHGPLQWRTFNVAYYYFVAFLVIFCFGLYPFRFPIVEFFNEILGISIRAY